MTAPDGTLDPRSEKLLPLLPIFVTISVTVVLGASLNLWIDEAFSLHTTEGGPLAAITQAVQFELQPPCYFLLLNLWRQLDASPFFARLFSILSIALELLVLTRIARRLFPSVHPFWFSTLMGANPFLIWAALEIRCYALVLLLSTLLFFFFLKAYLEEEEEEVARSSRWSYILLSLLALYTQYYLGFLLVAYFLPLLALQRYRAARAYLLDMLVVGLGAIPLFLLVPEHLSFHSGATVPPLTLSGAAKMIWWRLTYYILADSRELPLLFKTARASFLLFLGFLLVAFGVFRCRKLDKPSSIALWTPLLFMTGTYLVLTATLGETLTKARHTAFLFVPVTFAFLHVVYSFLGKKGLVSTILLIVLFNAVASFVHYLPMAKSGDWKHLAAYIMTSERPNQPVLVFRSEQVLPLAYHYSGINPLVPLPRVFSFRSWDLTSMALRDEKEVLDAIRNLPGPHQEFWLVTDSVDEYLGANFHPEILEKCVKDFFIVESCKTFYGSQARFLRLKESF